MSYASQTTSVVTVRPEGRLEGAQAVAFTASVEVLARLVRTEVVVDLTAVPSMDEAAATALSRARTALTARGGVLRVTGVRAGTRAVLSARSFGSETTDHDVSPLAAVRPAVLLAA